MEPTALTLVSALITEAHTRFGVHDVEAVLVPGDLLDGAMDHVLSIGGEVGLDSCVVDRVEVRGLPEGGTVPAAVVRGHDEPQPLTG
ncbi:MAG: hypothetical protein ACLGIR_06080 [Actinomycetes bacterium]